MINLNEGDRGVCVNGVQVTAIVFRDPHGPGQAQHGPGRPLT